MAKRRDFQAEYLRRISRAQNLGFSRSQARGHAKASESHIRAPKIALSDERVQAALTTLRKERNIAAAARSAKISTERLRKFGIERGLFEKAGRRWQAKQDLPRRVLVFSKGKALTIVVGNFEAASAAARYMSAVSRLLSSNKAAVLEPFVGHGVRDATGKFHVFETDPNSLYRLAMSGGSSFEQIYRIVI